MLFRSFIVGERDRRGLLDSSSEVGGVEVDLRDVELDPLADVWQLDSEGVGEWSRRLVLVDACGGGEGKSIEIPRPENLRLMSSSGEVRADTGGAGAGRGG